MCGIIGILGKHEAAPILVEALKRLNTGDTIARHCHRER